MQVQLWHEVNPNFKCPRTIPDMLGYEHVETFEIENDCTASAACERVFELSQNFDQSWKEGHRSTSVGDLMIILGVGVYGVNGIGMRELFREETLHVES